MDDRKKLVAVAGLRRADPTILQVLTQDVLRTPLVRIEPGTLADLLALSELGTPTLPFALARELERFQRQMGRELADMTDAPLAELIADLARLSPAKLPACLREQVLALAPDRRDRTVLEGIQAFGQHVDGQLPETLRLPSAPVRTPHGAPPPPVHKVQARPAVGVTRVRTPPAQVDQRRPQWIEADVLDRLAAHPGGLKESIVIAGARHRAPWQDLSEDEVLEVLRRLRREGRLKNESGRWIRKR